MIWRFAYGLGFVLAWCWNRVLRTRRTEMLHRVQARLGLPEESASGIVRGVYQCLARGLIEVFLTRLLRLQLPPTEVRGFEYLSELKKRNSGFVLVTAHLGNWELLTRLDYYCGIQGLSSRSGFGGRSSNGCYPMLGAMPFAPWKRRALPAISLKC